jgi:hypothetical protein
MPSAVYPFRGRPISVRGGTNVATANAPSTHQKRDYCAVSRGEFQLWLESGARCQPYQQVHAESVDLASLQIRHACLSHSKYLGGLSLRHAALFQPMLQAHQQHRAHLHLGRFFGREKIVKDTAPRRRHVTRAMFTVRNHTGPGTIQSPKNPARFPETALRPPCCRPSRLPVSRTYYAISRIYMQYVAYASRPS